MLRRAPREISHGQKTPQLEQSLDSLEALVERMESGELTLEESLQAFEQGVKLTRECQQALSQAEQRCASCWSRTRKPSRCLSKAAMTSDLNALDPLNATVRARLDQALRDHLPDPGNSDAPRLAEAMRYEPWRAASGSARCWCTPPAGSPAAAWNRPTCRRWRWS